MRYEVQQDFHVAEFDVQLQRGDVFADGDAEPDLVANLLAKGVIEPYRPPKPVKKTSKAEASEDE